MISAKYENLKRLFSQEKSVREFSQYLKDDEGINSYFKNSVIKNRIILIESQQAISNQISLSAFVPILTSNKAATAISYTLMKPKAHSRLTEQIRNRRSLYFAFGSRKHLLVSGKGKKFWETKYQSELTNPYELEKFSIDGVRIGDLIYDTYLRRTKNSTIDLLDSDFASIFDECVAYYFALVEIFKRNEIAAVCVSHCVYHFAIPLRLAISKGIETFQVTGEAVYRLTDKDTHAYTSFKYFPREFAAIPKNKRDDGLLLAKSSLDSRFRGVLSEHMPYSTKSAYARDLKQTQVIVRPTSKIKVLVAIHDFFDSPHSYGDNFYPDFQIWLSKLGEISTKTSYDWYIKTHRDPIGNPDKILEEFVKKYPKFQLIHKDIDHHTLIEQGIDTVLTVYGTIAMEYPYLGIPAINASLNNPHCAYSFSRTPQNAREYEEIILNLQDFRIEIKREEIIEYYFMANYYQLRSVTYLDYSGFIQSVGGYRASIGSSNLDFYLANPDKRIPRLELMEAMSNFISSNDLQLSRKHFSNPSINWTMV